MEGNVLASAVFLLVVTACSGVAPLTPAPSASAPGTQELNNPALPSVAAIARAEPGKEEVLLSTTTSTQDSGLLDVLLPDFQERTGYRLKPIAVGTGQALALGRRGEADVMLVHAPDAELEIVQSGDANDRRLVMHNDFVVVGPTEDPAHMKGMKTAVQAFRTLAEANAVFVSRGDDSGTHKMEQSLWQKAGVQPPRDRYVQTGAGMGQTLDVASERGGYTLTDRATYLALKKRVSLDIVLEGDAPLLNVYHVMLVNPAKHPKVNVVGGKAFADYLISRETQALIGTFGREKYGQPLFSPDAGRPESEIGG